MAPQCPECHGERYINWVSPDYIGTIRCPCCQGAGHISGVVRGIIVAVKPRPPLVIEGIGDDADEVAKLRAENVMLERALKKAREDFDDWVDHDRGVSSPDMREAEAREAIDDYKREARRELAEEESDG